MPDKEFDLHTYNIFTRAEIHYFLDLIFTESFASGYKRIRIITGRGKNSVNHPLIKPITENYLKHNQKISKYKLDLSLGAFDIWLVN